MVYIYICVNQRAHTHTCTVCYDMLLRSGFLTSPEQRLVFVNGWGFWIFLRHLKHGGMSLTPHNRQLHPLEHVAQSPRWVSRSLWWKRRTPPSQRPQRTFSNGRVSVFNNGFKRNTLSKIHFQNHDVGWQHLLLNTFERFLRVWNQEASWGGAGIKILLAVKYKRDPQGDEPGKERAALGGYPVVIKHGLLENSTSI